MGGKATVDTLGGTLSMGGPATADGRGKKNGLKTGYGFPATGKGIPATENTIGG